MFDLCILLDFNATTGSKPIGGRFLGMTLLGVVWFTFRHGTRFVIMLLDRFCFFDFEREGEPRLLDPYLLEPASVVITIASSGPGESSRILCVEDMFRLCVSKADGLTNFRFFLMSISLALNIDGSAL